MNINRPGINRPGLRRPGETDRAGGRRGVQPPRRERDRTGLYVGLGVGGGLLVLALAFAMSSGKTEAGPGDRSADVRLKEDLEAAQALAQAQKLEEALSAIETAIRNPAYSGSSLMPKAQRQAEQYRQQIAFERQAVADIDEFDKRVTASKANKTAMKQADALYRECNALLSKYRQTAKAGVLKGWLQDLERWRGTEAQDAWQSDYNYTRERIKTQFLDTENFSGAVKDWRRFAEPFSAPELKAKVESELRAIDEMAKKAAAKLVESAGTGPMAKQKLEAAMDRFMETEGQKIITQKLKTFP